jgi:pullulanase-type alpha-1,6-glucosidase
VALLATAGGGTAAAQAPADCDAAAPWRTLQALPASSAPAAPGVAGAAPEARALWLGRSLLRWPQVAVEGAAGPVRFRLLHAARGGVVASAGAAARGFDRALALSPHTGVVPQAAAFAWAGEGATLAVAPRDVPRLPALLRGELVLVQEDAQGRVLQATRVQHAAALDDWYASAESLPDLGATVVRTRQATRTQFRLWAPTAQQVQLCLHGAEAGATRGLPLQRDERTGAWSLQHGGDLSGRAYTYLVDVFVPGTGLVRNRVTDPYSQALTTDSQRSVVVDLDHPDTQPPGWATAPRPQPLAAPTDLVVYELHVRDFSASDTSVPAALRGKYGAFALPDSQGVRHLRRLAQAGVTDLHLLPVFDLATVPEAGCSTPDHAALATLPPDSREQQARVMADARRDCFNWGYDPLHFNTPEGSFAQQPDGAARIAEFRRMVMALQAMGLRVGLDKVYNHTSASGQHAQSVLDRVVPGYYHRLNAQGQVERSTCCDNTATEHRMMAKLMVDSAVLWVRQYRIDSFRFDLMGHQPRAAMERLQKAVDLAAGRHIPLIGEGWNFGEVADGRRFVQASQLSLNGSGIATFSDRGRDALRGGGAGDGGEDQIARQGYLNGLHYAPNALAQAKGQGTREQLLQAADLVRAGLAGTLRRYPLATHTGEVKRLEQLVYGGNQPAGYASQPGEVVNYVENHDNQTLFDANVFKLPADTSREDRARVQVLGAALNAFSQGVAYFHAGQEVLRSKSLDRNSYDSGDWFNRMDWSLQTNHFGTGLPPQNDNGSSWPLMQPLLARAADIAPRPQDITFTRDATLDLLKIRASSSLLRLRTEADVLQRLRFHNTGPGQVPTVVVGQLDGRGYPGANFGELLYLVNVAPQAQTLSLPALAGRPYRLHPVHLAAEAGDPRVRQATVDATTGTFTVPARTAVVWVLPPER